MVPVNGLVTLQEAKETIQKRNRADTRLDAELQRYIAEASDKRSSACASAA